MPSKATLVKAIKAASIYIEMRGYIVLEQNWSLGKNKIDIIASKGNCIYFIEVDVHEPNSAGFSIVDQTKINKIKSAAGSWLQENKWAKPYSYSSIIVDEKMNILSFNADLSY